MSVDRLKMLCARSANLQPLNSTVDELVEATKRPFSANSLSQIISKDPILLARVFRHGSSVIDDDLRDRPTTIADLLQRIGEREFANFVNLLKEGSLRITGTRVLDPVRFARHSLFVSYFASKLIQVINEKQGTRFWHPDEIQCAGMLHDLGYGLLFQVAPDIGHRLHQEATLQQKSVERVYQEEFGEGLDELGAFVADTWSLAPLFPVTMRSSKFDVTDTRNFIAAAVMTYSKTLANLSGYTVSDQYEQPNMGMDVLSSIGLMNEEAKVILQQVVLRVEQIYPLRMARAA